MNPLLGFPLDVRRDEGPVTAAIGFAFGSNYEASRTQRSSFLHRHEEKRWSEFKHDRRQRSYLLGRQAAKGAFTVCFPATAAGEIDITNGVLGQPWLQAPPGLAAEFSLAHTDDAGAAVVCQPGHPMGIDVERMDPERANVARSCLLPEESAAAAGLALSETSAALVLWGMREALAKVLRCGLTLPLPLLATENITGGVDSIRAEFRNFRQYRAESWLMGDYVLSLALPRKSRLRFDAVNAVRPLFAAAGLTAAAPLPPPAS